MADAARSFRKQDVRKFFRAVRNDLKELLMSLREVERRQPMYRRLQRLVDRADDLLAASRPTR